MIMGSVKDLLEMGDTPLLGGKIKECIQRSGQLMAGDRHSEALVVIIVISNITVSVVAHINQNYMAGLVGLHINHFAVGRRSILTKFDFGVF